MSVKRKDSKGRVLRSGESERSQSYQYRYNDGTRDENGKKKWLYIYAPTLEELRKKEDAINEALQAGTRYSEGNITVLELLERYISLKQGVRYNTEVGYNYVLNIVRKEPFGYRKIRDIRTSDAKLWFQKLQREGKGYSTITEIRGVVNPAFQLACEDDILVKNPFNFQLKGVIENDSKKRIALTPEQTDIFMGFIQNDKHFCRYYDEFMVLLETGMRVSELCGLTKSELDFENRSILVDHQLVRQRGGVYYVERTKTESGCRYIPMTDNVYQALKNILEHRVPPNKEKTIDGYSGFILLDKDRNPYVALHIEHHMQWALKKYSKLHPEQPLPHITPHVLRHTFCTNLANAGMGVKDLQYLMGHSDARVTMDVYTHASYNHAKEAMQRIFSFKGGGQVD